MGRSHVLEELTHKQLNRMLLKVPHPKIQRLLLSGYQVFHVDPLLYQILLKKPGTGYRGTRKEIVVYPHSLVNLGTYIKQKEASCESRALLLRHNAARVIKTLRSKNTKTEVQDDRIIAFISRTDDAATKKKFDRWRSEVSTERRKKKEKLKTPEGMAARIQSHIVKKATAPGHIICAIIPTKKRRKKLMELLGDEKFIYTECKYSYKALEDDAQDFIQNRLDTKETDSQNAANAGSRHSLVTTIITEVMPKKNLIIFSKTIKACDELFGSAVWVATRKNYNGTTTTWPSNLHARALGPRWRSHDGGGLLEAY